MEVEEEAYLWLLKLTKKDRQYGARPLRRIIQRHVEDPLAERFVTFDDPIEGTVKVQFGDNKLNLIMPAPPSVEKEEEAECHS